MRDFSFFVAIAFGIGLSVLVATPFMKTDIEGGDWLSFAGAMIGVGLAVFGALAVEHEKERRAMRRTMARLTCAISQIEGASRFVAQMNWDGSPADKAMALRGRALLVLKAIDAIQYTMSRIDVDDVDLWSSMNSVVTGFTELRTLLGQCINLDWGALPEEKQTEGRAMLLQRFLQAIAPYLADAKRLANTITSQQLCAIDASGKQCFCFEAE